MALSQATQEMIKSTIQEGFASLSQQVGSFPACITQTADITALRKEQATQTGDFERLRKAIKGNGEDGLEKKVLIHEQQIQALIDFKNEVKGYANWLLLLVASLLITSIANLILK